MAKRTEPDGGNNGVTATQTVRRDERVRDGYYVYGLIDPAALRETGDNRLLSIFYVGKGHGSRWAAHEKDAHTALVREQEKLAERVGSKDERIRTILDKGHHVPAVLLSAGYLDSDDAYQAESLAIDTIGALLAAAGRPPLTNAAPGHHAGFVWLREHFVYTQTSEQDLEPAPADVDRPDGPVPAATEILVKGNTSDLLEPGQQRGDRSLLPAAVASVLERVMVIDLLGTDHPDTRVRRRWDPLDPWTDLEARDRARRYWPIAADRVAGWIRDPVTMPASLLLGIEESGGRTVVRYAWSIDRDLAWEYYPKSNRWGVPLGERLREHPRLGAALYETRGDRRVQVLTNYVSGFRVLTV